MCRWSSGGVVAERGARGAHSDDGTTCLRGRQGQAAVTPHRRRVAGRQGAALFVGAGLLTLLNNLVLVTDSQDTGLLAVVGVAAVALGLAGWWVPWHGWHARMLLVPAVLALVLVAVANTYGGVSDLSYAVYFLLAFLYIGLAQPPWTGVWLTPVAVLAYVAPELLGRGRPHLVESVTVAVPACVLVAEVVARSLDRLQRAIEDNMRLARQLTDAHRVAHLGTWEWDVAADSVTWSDEMFRIFGLEPGQLVPTLDGYLSQVHPADRSRVREVIAGGLDGRSSFDAEHRVLRPGGEVAWMSARGEVVRDTAGTPVLMRGIAQDITLSKEANAAVRAQRDRLAAAVSATGDAVITTTVDGQILDWNTGASRLYGYARDQAVGQPISMLVATESRDNYESTMRTLSPGQHATLESNHVRKDGTVVPTSVTLSVIPDAEGEVAALVSISRDITARQEATRAAHQAALDLAAQAEELRRLAFRDPLTGLANRSLFQDRLRQALVTRSRPVTVLLLDLDEFKLVNDVLGHAAGDQLLIEIARRLVSCVRPSDTVARLGGDEFAVVLDGASNGEEVADRILAALTERAQVEDQQVVPRASIGIASSPDDQLEPAELLRRADIAMYTAKAAGRNRHRVFASHMVPTGLSRRL